VTESLPGEGASEARDGEQGPDGLLAWLRSQGAATQAMVPGLYAWAVTMAPVGWTPGASTAARSAVAAGLASLLLGPIVERRAPNVARLAMGWGLVVSALLTWTFASEAAVRAFDAARGIAGMFGWAVFAFAVASPSREPGGAVARPAALSPRAKRKRRDTPLLLLGIALVVALEIPGWRVESRDRALLLRVVALAGGLGIVTAAATIAVEHHRPRKDGPRARRRRVPATAVAWVGGAFLLLGAGIAYESLGSP
jgi:hypothetical protein